MDEKDIVGAHGDRNELCTRLDRVLEILKDDSPEKRRQDMYAAGYDCGSEARIFYRCYEQDPVYVDGFVRGAAEYLEVEGSEDDAKAAGHFLDMWEDPALTSEEKIELVVEPLLDDCEIRDDEGELWRL